MSRKCDHFFKLIIVGKGVGKTSLLLSFCEKKFYENVITTIGIDYRINFIEVEGKLIKLQIWDTNGASISHDIIRNYYRSIHGIIIAYDITDYNSFESITNYWLKDIKENAPQNIIKVLVGNKCDKPNRVITEEEGKKLAEKYCMSFFETSAKSGLNVNEVFLHITKQILNKLEILEKAPKKKNQKDF